MMCILGVMVVAEITDWERELLYQTRLLIDAMPNGIVDGKVFLCVLISVNKYSDRVVSDSDCTKYLLLLLVLVIERCVVCEVSVISVTIIGHVTINCRCRIYLLL